MTMVINLRQYIENTISIWGKSSEPPNLRFELLEIIVFKQYTNLGGFSA